MEKKKGQREKRKRRKKEGKKKEKWENRGKWREKDNKIAKKVKNKEILLNSCILHWYFSKQFSQQEF